MQPLKDKFTYISCEGLDDQIKHDLIAYHNIWLALDEIIWDGVNFMIWNKLFAEDIRGGR